MSSNVLNTPGDQPIIPISGQTINGGVKRNRGTMSPSPPSVNSMIFTPKISPVRNLMKKRRLHTINESDINDEEEQIEKNIQDEERLDLISISKPVREEIVVGSEDTEQIESISSAENLVVDSTPDSDIVYEAEQPASSDGNITYWCKVCASLYLMSNLLD